MRYCPDRFDTQTMDALTILFVAAAVILGGIVGWLAAQPARARLRAELEKNSALNAERVRAYEQAEGRFREAFASLSAQALNKNNEAFLQLAETRLGKARSETTADMRDSMAPSIATVSAAEKSWRAVS